LQTATSQRTDQSLQKSVPARPKKKFIFFQPFSVLIFLSTHKPRPTSILTVQSKQKVLLQLDTDDRTPSANSGFAKAGMQCFG
jgi:hypothetical protein